MNYKSKLEKLQDKEYALIKTAEIDGYIYDKKTNSFTKKEDLIYVIHIAINTLGCGEELGCFEIYDKVFIIEEEFAMNALKANTLDDFIQEVLISRDWDIDAMRSNLFEEVSFADWFYVERNESYHDNYENIISFKYSCYDSTLGNVAIMKCSADILNKHKNIYHYTKNYMFK